MSEASRLQRVETTMRTKWMTVGLLAMLGLSACGVGLDDPEGQAALGINQQPLAQQQQTVYVDSDGKVLAIVPEVVTPQALGSPQTPGGNGNNALPQDPVPIHDPGNPPSTTTVVVHVNTAGATGR
jgi:hypothetical protein